MGYGIEAHSEIKINGVWHHLSEVAITENYDLFGRMAGFASDVPPIAEPRGLPEDVSFLTKFLFDSYGAESWYSPSYLSRGEMGELEKWVEERWKGEKYAESWRMLGCLFNTRWGYENTTGSWPDGVEDARLVFWFD